MKNVVLVVLMVVASAEHTDHTQHEAAPPAPAHGHHEHPVGGAAAASAAEVPAGEAPAAPLGVSTPTSNAEMQAVQPASTLQPDAFDAPAPTAVEEANKAAGVAPASHDHGTPKKEQ